MRYASMAAALSLAAAGLEARADVAINQTITFDGFGERGWLAREGLSVLTVSGDKMREISTSQPTGKVLKRFADSEGLKIGVITRLDDKVLYRLDFKNRSFEEIRIKKMAGDIEQAAKAMMGAYAPKTDETAGEEPKVKWSPMKLEARRTGEKETINGFPSERAIVTGTLTGENIATKQACSLVLKLDQWMTPLTKDLAEVKEFHLKLARALGVDMRYATAFAELARQTLADSTEGFEGVVKELEKLDGYPIRSRMTIERGGDCGVSIGSLGEAGDASARAPIADISKAFRGMPGKKKEGQESDSGAVGSSTPGLKKVFGITTEIKSISTNPAPADAFHPPADFKKKTPGSVEEKPKAGS